MKNNLHSLLSSNWMLDDSAKSSLIPFLFKVINGNQTELSLNTTAISFISNKGDVSIGTSSKEITETSVGIIKMHHPIFKYDQECGPKGTQTIQSILKEWESNPNISAALLDINSGGGQASGTSEFAEFNYYFSKPLGVYTNDVIGSAAYYAAAPADFIMANKHADFIGCIGTMFQKLDVTGILEKKGAKIHELYADLSPEKNLQSRELANGNPKPLIEKLLNPNAEKFHADLKIYRPQITEKALKGDIFSPEEALKEGLIDELGTFKDAIDKLLSLANTSNTSQTQNTTQMSQEINVPNVQNTLGYDTPFQSTENGVFLQEAELNSIDKALATSETNASINSEAEQAIDAALTNAEIEFSTEQSIAEKINLLNDQRNEFAVRPATTPTAVAPSNKQSLDEPEVKEYAHNVAANQVLNQ